MLFGRALIDGLVFSVVFGGMVTLMEVINPRLQLHNYPPDIQKEAPPKTKEERKKFRLMAVPMSFFLIIFLIGTVIEAYQAKAVGYFTLLLHYLIIFLVWNVFDMVIMDWVIFCTITPKFLVIPGTEGNPAYKNYKFHINGCFGKGLLIAIISSILAAGICFILLAAFR